ncbi:MAG: hypothetical protein ACRC7N_16980, partial [Clostridium sp.]
GETDLQGSLMVCEKCNDFIEKDIELNGRIRRVKRICKCKAESMKESERIERANEILMSRLF